MVASPRVVTTTNAPRLHFSASVSCGWGRDNAWDKELGPQNISTTVESYSSPYPLLVNTSLSKQHQRNDLILTSISTALYTTT